MRSPIYCFSLSVAVLMALAAPSPGQSVADCQTASKLYAEAEVLQDIFSGLAPQIKGPAISGDETATKGVSLQDAVKFGLDDCKQGNGPASCGNYKRIRDAWLANQSTGGGSAARGMATDPQTCRINFPDGEEATEGDAPAEGFARIDFLSMFRHEQLHQKHCMAKNRGLSAYPSGSEGMRDKPSPYTTDMRDPEKQAKEEVAAYDVTKSVLEDYMKQHCFDPELSIEAGGLSGRCGDSPSGGATLRSGAAEARDYVVNTASKWLSVGTAGPVHTPPHGETSVPLKGDCNCCRQVTKQGEVRVYSGPGDSVMVAKAPVTMGCASHRKCAGASGDPHMHTFDGLAYDFQGAGEYVLARGEGFEVQARMEPVRSRPVSMSKVVAASLNGDRVAIYAGKPFRLTLQGKPVTLEPGEEITLPAGGLVRRDKRLIRMTTPAGFVLEVRPAQHSLSLNVGIPAGAKSVGLLGNLDENRANDLCSAEGVTLSQPVKFDELYSVFGDSWRVTAKDSLFDYAEGESPETFANLAFPGEPVHARNLGGKERRQAESICRQAGVADPIHLENCVLDVGVTGDEEFAQIAAEQSEGLTRLEVQPAKAGSADTQSATAAGITLTAPRKALASFSFDVDVGGPATRDYRVELAPLGSPDNKSVAAQRLSNGPQTAELIAPTESGEYELRYKAMGARGQVLIRLPLELVDPVATIEGAATAPAGGKITARCVGECSPHANLTVVPVGSPDTLMGAHAYLTGDSEVTIYRLPKEPGEYEIRYVTRRQPRRVFARKPLRLE